MKTIWRILKLLGDYKWLTILGFALAFAQMGLGLVVPRIIQLTINNALIGGETALLVTYGLALLGIAIVRFVVGVGRRLASGKASLGIEYDLRNRMWAHVLRQSFSYFDRWPTGQLMSRAMSDVQNVRMFLGYGLIFFVTNIVMMVAVAVILLVMDWQLALMSLAFLPFLLLVTVRFSFRLKPILMDVQQKIADVHGRGRGERGRQPHRAHLRARGRRAHQVQRPQLQGVRGERGRGAHASRLHPAHRLHPQPRRRLPAVLRRAPGDRRQT